MLPRHIASVLVMAVGGIATIFGLKTNAGVVQDATDRAVIEETRGFAAFYTCFEQSLDRQLVAGTKVFVAAADDLWQQRLTEMATPRLRVVDQREDAEHTLSYDASQADCRLRVIVRPVTVRSSTTVTTNTRTTTTSLPSALIV